MTSNTAGTSGVAEPSSRQADGARRDTAAREGDANGLHTVQAESVRKVADQCASAAGQRPAKR